MSVGEAQSGSPVKKINLSMATGTKVLVISLSQSEKLKLYFTPCKASTLLWQTQGLTVSSTTKPLLPQGKNKYPKIQLFLKLCNLFSNFPSVPIWLFQPFSSPPLTIQPIAHRAPCPISTADLAQWPGRSSNKYTDLILWTYLPSHQMSSTIRVANLFVFLPHFQTQVVPVSTALHRPSPPQRTLLLSRPLSFLAPF